MDAGDVEQSGAVGFDSGESESHAEKNTENTVETANEVASVKEEDIRFRFNDIQKNDMFVRVEGGERRKRAAERREKLEQKQSLREAEESTRVEKNTASKAVVDSEKQLKREQRRIAKEQRKRERASRRKAFVAWIEKHWYIFVIILILAAAGAIAWLIISNHLAGIAKEEAEVETHLEYENNKVKINEDIFENKDGNQPWTGIKQYQELINQAVSQEEKARLYYTRSNQLYTYLLVKYSSDEEIIKYVLDDARAAVEIDQNQIYVCHLSDVLEAYGEQSEYEAYYTKCESLRKQKPVDEHYISNGDEVDGEG